MFRETPSHELHCCLAVEAAADRAVCAPDTLCSTAAAWLDSRQLAAAASATTLSRSSIPACAQGCARNSVVVFRPASCRRQGVVGSDSHLSLWRNSTPLQHFALDAKQLKHQAAQQHWMGNQLRFEGQRDLQWHTFGGAVVQCACYCCLQFLPPGGSMCSRLRCVCLLSLHQSKITLHFATMFCADKSRNAYPCHALSCGIVQQCVQS